MKTVFSLLTVFSLGLVAIVAAQQDEEFKTPADTAPAVEDSKSETSDNAIRVSLTKDGVLTGMVFKRVDDRQQPVTAKVTLANLDGETLSTDMTEKDGSFKFDSIEPGYYTIVGVGPGYYGDQTIDVTSYGEAYTAQVPVEVAPGFDAGVAYAGYQDAPLATFSCGCATGNCGGGTPVFSGGGCGVGSCGSCGGGCGGGGFGGGGGRLLGGGRGGLRSLLPLVGLAGLAGLSNDDDDDISPTL